MRDSARWGVDWVQRALAIDPIACWPMDEKAGGVAYDWVSGRVAGAQNGLYTGVTLGEPGPGDGRTCPFFDGGLDYLNIWSPELAAAFNGAEGTLGLFGRVANAGVWIDAVLRNFARITGDATNLIFMLKHSNPNTLSLRFIGNGVTVQRDLNPITDTNWMALFISWSQSLNKVRMFRNAVQIGADAAHPGWTAASLSATGCCIGAGSTGPTNLHHGWDARAILMNRAATPAEVLALSTVV